MYRCTDVYVYIYTYIHMYVIFCASSQVAASWAAASRTTAWVAWCPRSSQPSWWARAPAQRRRWMPVGWPLDGRWMSRKPRKNHRRMVV